MDPAYVASILAEGADAATDDAMREALLLIEKFTLRPEELGPDDVRRAREAGLTDEAIEHAFYVSALFNVEDRLADAFDFHVLEKEEFDRLAPIVLRLGYRFFAG
ncbi:MAG TPA: hypothetical protein VG318_06140 [Actinomycetota bacterium]|nr:hypothetical protein [Actinomycetota bacterium]